ncbi:threonine dehydrogenase-like Zn-dependent dehydrogenase [Rhodanobacter sp. A1T4]|nr:threonine dehydrogenase-like Zn-dependent dehydrogenase [Rhodanobacter sp. A1T4]
MGDAFDKDLSFQIGQKHVQKYLPELLNQIENGDLKPDAIISHRMKFADAVEGYKIFNEQTEDCRKIVFTP